MKLRVAGALTADELSRVLGLIAAATAADDCSPVSEETLLHLRHPGLDHHARHILALVDDRVVGYGALLPTEGPAARMAEIAVDPPSRSHGVGRAIIEQVLAEVGDRSVSLWARGEATEAASLASSMGFDHARTLLQMRRSLTNRLPDMHWPPGFQVRTFRPGHDDAVFLAANAAAFRALPDQGSWQQSDLDARLAEPWYDPEGFFLVISGGELAGFHWTKMHAPEPHGEVYVLAVAPGFVGQGLGTPLALHGLRHLRHCGATAAMLYVDEANTRAVRLYQRLGFASWGVDQLYVRDGGD